MPGKKVSANAESLLNIFVKSEFISTQDAVAQLNISQATARRLFRTMVENGTALRTLGGITRTLDTGSEYFYDLLSSHRAAAKQIIAQKACALCKDGDILYLDGGTTLALFAEALQSKISAGELKDIVIYTNALSIPTTFSSVCKIYMLGGRWRENRRDFCGYLAENAIRRLHFTACFLGADACEKRGLTTTDFETARLAELAVAGSDRKYALIDSSKFTKASFVPYCALSQMTGIITDDALDISTAADFTALGAKLL